MGRPNMHYKNNHGKRKVGFIRFEKTLDVAVVIKLLYGWGKWEILYSK